MEVRKRRKRLNDSVPMNYEFGDSVVVPLKAGEKLKWKCYHSNYSVCYRIPS